MFRIIKKGNFMYYVYDDEKLIKIFHKSIEICKRTRIITGDALSL